MLQIAAKAGCAFVLAGPVVMLEQRQTFGVQQAGFWVMKAVNQSSN